MTAKTESNVAPALAAWESATMHNLSPLLSQTQATVLWNAIVDYRKTSDIVALENVVAALYAEVSPIVGRALGIALQNLIALSPAAPSAAKE